MVSLVKPLAVLNLFPKFLKPRIEILTVPNREKFWYAKPKKRIPPWLPKQTRILYDEQLTSQNKDFLKEVIEEKYGTRDPYTLSTSPLKVEPIEPVKEWNPGSRRTGVIARNLGIYPMWLKNGKKIHTTLLHVCDNHVIKYISPEEWEPKVRTKYNVPKRKLACLLVGADSTDPQMFTRQYCGLFSDSGVMPKKILGRFPITPDAALQPGTPLYAAHFKPGCYVDVRGKTIDRGFQGVMKRWGFKGMPATHGTTKTHRKPGCVGSGGTKARVMPGQKLPGHMGNRYRLLRGLQVLRVNHKHNVIWLYGQGIAGDTNSFVYVYDSVLSHKSYRTLKTNPVFPTYLAGDEKLPDEVYLDTLHNFSDPSIEIPEEIKKKV